MPRAPNPNCVHLKESEIERAIREMIARERCLPADRLSVLLSAENDEGDLLDTDTITAVVHVRTA